MMRCVVTNVLAENVVVVVIRTVVSDAESMELAKKMLRALVFHKTGQNDLGDGCTMRRNVNGTMTANTCIKS